MDEINTKVINNNNLEEKKNLKKDPKEILMEILRKTLEPKLNKLEIKQKEEINSFKILSKISQNIIYSLDYFSHKVRKEIYKIKHKNDENHYKKEESQESNKRNNIYNNNEIITLNDKQNNDKSLLDISRISNKKKPSKSIDVKKNKALLTEVNNKEKNKKDKLDVFERLSSKSIGNMKKLKITVNNNNTSKPSLKKSTGSTKNIHNIKKSDNEKEKSPENKVDSPYIDGKSKSKLKLISTPRMKSKSKKITNINLDNTTMTSESAKSLILTERIKKNNSKGKLINKVGKATSGLKKDVNKTIDIPSKILTKRKSKTNLNLDSKREQENKEQNGKEQKKEVSENNNSFKDKISMDEEMLKTMNKDELLVSRIKSQNEIKIEEFDIKKSININVLDEQLKKSNNESINNINISENNNSLGHNSPINNVKLVNSINENSQSNNNISNNNINQNNNDGNNFSDNNLPKINNSQNKLDNIIFSNPKNNPTNFLDKDTDINFTLVEDFHPEDNENDTNKTIDLNISGLSYQMSLEEKFESHLDEISRYLDIKDLCNLMLVNKECFTTIMNVLISKTEITIDILEEEISKIKEGNKNIDFEKLNIPPFQFSSNSSRAVSLLNNSSGCNLIKFQKSDTNVNKEIFIIFGIFFIASGKKNQFMTLHNDEDKMKYIINFFKNDIDNMSLGSLIEKEINGKIFDDNIISSLYSYSNKYKNIISPNRFQKVNKDVAIFVFVIKNILEHIGIFDQQNNKPDKEYILYKARLKTNKQILEQLNNFYEKIN